MSGLNPSDHDLQPATERPSCTQVNEIQEIEFKNSIPEISMITLSVALNMYVVAVIKYGIVHLAVTMFKLDTFRRKINLSTYSIYANT